MFLALRLQRVNTLKNRLSSIVGVRVEKNYKFVIKLKKAKITNSNDMDTTVSKAFDMSKDPNDNTIVYLKVVQGEHKI